MKFDDKIIEQITARLTEEIEEIAEEEHKAAEAAAKAAAETMAPEAKPEISAELAEEIAKEQNFLDISELLDEVNHMTDGIVEDEAIVEDEIIAGGNDETGQPEEESTPVADEDSEELPVGEDSEELLVGEDSEELSEEEPSEENAAEDAPVEEPAAEETAAPVEIPVAASSKMPAFIAPALYILTLIVVSVISVAAINLLDNSIQKNKPEIPADIAQSNLSASLQTYTANEVFAQKAVPNYTLEEIYALDLRQPSGATEEDLKKITKAGLVGLEDTFLEAEKQYGVNAIFLISIASLESAHGTAMYRPNNMFGYGGKSYPSKEACIMDVAQGLGTKYLQPGASLYGGSPTLAGVNKRYAANPQWYAKVGKYMKGYYEQIAPVHNQQINKIM